MWLLVGGLWSLAGDLWSFVVAAFFSNYDFMQIQLIYEGKTIKCLPRFKLPGKFSLSYDEAHYSDENEACNFIEEILQLYISKIIHRENLPV